MENSSMSSGLRLSDEEMRSFGYEVIDSIIKHISELHQQPVTTTASRFELEQRLREPIPEQGADPHQVLEQVLTKILPNIAHTDHPRFFAYVPSPGNFVSVMAEALAAGFNVFAGHWLVGSGPAEIELVTIDWLRQLCDLPEIAGGLFVSGGSMANLTAIATARRVCLGEHRFDAVIYCSDQTHSSLQKGLRILGFRDEQLRKIATGADYRLDCDDLQRRITADCEAGLRPFCVVANAGTTNTGAIDPLEKISAICRSGQLWMHVDGAYGVAAILSDEGRKQLSGLKLADSITLDPHKWWFQPYEIGCVLVQDMRHLQMTFGTRAEYLKETLRDAEEINFYDYGPQLTRSFRALKLWLSIKVFGLAAFREAVSRGIYLARFAEGLLREDPDWEIATPAQIGIITFRYRPPGFEQVDTDAATGEIVKKMLAGKYAMVTSTELNSRPVLRMCTINPQTSEEDIRKTIQELKRLGESQAMELRKKSHRHN